MKLLVYTILISFLGLSTPVDSLYTIDKSKSKLNWTGYYLFSFGEHAGSVDIQEGTLKVSNGNLVGGKIKIDMKTIDAQDEGFEGKDDLSNHLMNADFFEVDKYPVATLDIINVTQLKDAPPNGPNVEVKGTLTLKGVSQEITFPTTLVIQDKQLTARARFKIDRTKWNVKYNFGKYFSEIGDGAISDAIGISFDVIATTNTVK